MFYTYLVTEVVYHWGEQHRIRKNLKLYIVLQRNALVDIKISIIDICYTNTARYLKFWWFLYFINEKFNKNAKVEKLTKKLGRGVRLIVKGPLIFMPRFLAMAKYESTEGNGEARMELWVENASNEGWDQLPVYQPLSQSLFVRQATLQMLVPHSSKTVFSGQIQY